MISTANSKNNKVISTIAAILLSIASILGLQGCSSSSDTTPPPPLPDQDASGLYKSGTGTLDGTSVSDIIGFVHDNRITAFSVTAHILIDGTINSVTVNDYTATVSVYKDGVLSQANINVTGMVTNGSSIDGTLNGTGTAAGSFSLVFDTLYSRGASFSRVDTNPPSSSFVGNIMSSMINATTSNFNFDLATVYDMLQGIPGPIRCVSNGTYTIPDNSINIYALDETITQTDIGCTMSETPNYTGFAAVIDGLSADDTLLYAVTNGTNAQFAVLSK